MPSLTELQAIDRAALISNVSYAIDLDFTTSTTTFVSRTTATFECATPGTATFLELHAASAVQVVCNGQVLAPECYANGRIQLPPLEAHNTVTVMATLPYAADGDGMYRMQDPVDQQCYVSGFAGMDVAQRMFACFDQPDIKASMVLTVTADSSWTVLGNGSGTATNVNDTVTRWEFTPTQPIATYLFVVCAGPWASRTWQHDGRTFGWHARASLADALDRDFAELQHITQSCYDYYHTVFDAPYPFGDYHQIFAPGLNWGALETPGCITYRDEKLFPEPGTPAERTSRAVTIAHEMAHMWFGNLVTMTWWEDTWLQESFADYMGFRVAHDAAGFTNSWVGFSLVGKIKAYGADSCRSTHPVAPGSGAVPDVDAAFNNFDLISYAKGTASLQQLVSWMGDEEFFAGLNAYLNEHAFGNAKLADLITALAGASTKPVREWAQVWLHQSGFDELRGEQSGATYRLACVGHRPHTVQVGVYSVAGELTARSVMVDVTPESPAEFAVGAGEVVLPNALNNTFAHVRLPQQAWSDVLPLVPLLPTGQERASVWCAGLMAVARGELAAEHFCAALVEHVPAEQDAELLDRVLTRALHQLAPVLAQEAYLELSGQLSAALLSRPQVSDEVLDVRTRWHVALATAPEVLREYVRTGCGPFGTSLPTDIRWAVWERLCALGAATVAEIEAMHAADPTVRGELAAVTCRAALPDAELKVSVFQEFCAPDAAAFTARTVYAVLAGLWQPHQPWAVQAPAFKKYVQLCPQIAAVGQGVAGVAGGNVPWFMATAEVIDQLKVAVDHPAVTQVLARRWNDAIDDMVAVQPVSRR